MTEISRRSFLKGIAVTAGSLAAFGIPLEAEAAYEHYLMRYGIHKIDNLDIVQAKKALQTYIDNIEKEFDVLLWRRRPSIEEDTFTLQVSARFCGKRKVL